MAQPPADINAILAALNQQNQRASSSQGQSNAIQSPTAPTPYSAPGTSLPAPTSSGTVSGSVPLPPPSGSGNFDISSIKPANSGSVSLQDAIAKAQGIAAQSVYGSASRLMTAIDPAVDRPPSNYRSRSRSPRRDGYNDGYNPYRDERRSDRGRGGRDRSMSPGRRNNRGQNEDKDSDVIQVDSNAVGLIIGRAGENMRRIESESGARVQFITGPEGAGQKRSCRVSGNPRQRADAIADIFRTQAENHAKQSGQALPPPSRQQMQSPSNLPPLREGERNSQIMVPDKTVGLIIGRGGETIRDLQERSGCHVNITGENKSIGGYRPVNLIGTPQAASRAREMIFEIVDSDTRQQEQQRQQQQQQNSQTTSRRDNYPPSSSSGNYATPSSGNYGPSQYANAPYDPYGANAPKETENIQVPSEAVGMIIGKGGETIKDMQNVSGCKINVSQPQGADIQRPIELIGSRPAIEHAKRLIWEKVNAVRDKQGGGGSGGSSSRNQNPPQSSYSGSGYGSANSPAPYSQGPPNMPPPRPGEHDPYAPYGGYQNYMAMWAAAGYNQQGSAAN